MWKHDSDLWKGLERFSETGSGCVAEAPHGSRYCPDILGVRATYFLFLKGLNSPPYKLVCHCQPQGPCMRWKLILPVGKSFIFMQLVCAAWRDLAVFGQLNNVNLKPINILLWFGLRKIFSTLNKRREGHLFPVWETGLADPSVKSQSPCRAGRRGLQEEMCDERAAIKLQFVRSSSNICLHVRRRVAKCPRQYYFYYFCSVMLLWQR